MYGTKYQVYTYRASMSDDVSFEQRREPVVCAIVSDHVSRLFVGCMPLLRCSSNTAELKKCRVQSANSQGKAGEECTECQQCNCKKQHSVPSSTIGDQVWNLFGIERLCGIGRPLRGRPGLSHVFVRSSELGMNRS
jgi:hypothetical protein